MPRTTQNSSNTRQTTKNHHNNLTPQQQPQFLKTNQNQQNTTKQTKSPKFFKSPQPPNNQNHHNHRTSPPQPAQPAQPGSCLQSLYHLHAHNGESAKFGLLFLVKNGQETLDRESNFKTRGSDKASKTRWLSLCAALCQGCCSRQNQSQSCDRPS